MASVRIAVIYYSSTGTIYDLATHVAAGAEEAGAEVRLRRVPELAPEEAISANPAWKSHRDAVAEEVAVASTEDMLWANGYAFGTPTRFGNVSAQLKQFMDGLGGLWGNGSLTNKPVTSFTSAMNPHGGQESTILALNNTFYHWGSIIVPPGYADPMIFASGGNPYGVSWSTGSDGDSPDASTLASARFQGARLAAVTGAMVAAGMVT